MSRGVLVLLLAGSAAAFTGGCGAARQARKARKAAAAGPAASQRAWKDAVERDANPHDPLTGVTDTALFSTYSEGDTIETSLLDPSRLAVPPALLQAHAYRRPFRTFSAKAKVDYTAGQESQQFTAHVRIRRDSAIWINVRAVAGTIPVARLLLTPDSLRVLNYLQNEAHLYPVGETLTRLPFPVTFSQVQAALLGETFEPTAPVTGAGRAEESGDVYVDTETQTARLRSYYRLADTTLTGEDFSILQLWSGQIRYTDLEAAPAFPMRREFTLHAASDGDHALNAGTYMLSIRYTDAPRVDETLDFPFAIPKNYKLK